MLRPGPLPRCVDRPPGPPAPEPSEDNLAEGCYVFCCIPSISSLRLPARARWTLKPGSKTTQPCLFAAGRELASTPQTTVSPAKKGPVRPSPYCCPACCLRRGRRFGRLDGTSFLPLEQPCAQDTGTQTGTTSAAPGASRYRALPPAPERSAGTSGSNPTPGENTTSRLGRYRTANPPTHLTTLLRTVKFCL